VNTLSGGTVIPWRQNCTSRSLTSSRLAAQAELIPARFRAVSRRAARARLRLWSSPLRSRCSMVCARRFILSLRKVFKVVAAGHPRTEPSDLTCRARVRHHFDCQEERLTEDCDGRLSGLDLTLAHSSTVCASQQRVRHRRRCVRVAGSYPALRRTFAKPFLRQCGSSWRFRARRASAQESS
jgi:hypothetical protein